MPDTWTVVTSTGSWDAMPPTAFALSTESDITLHTETDEAILVDFTVTTWSTQTNGAATWNLI